MASLASISIRAAVLLATVGMAAAFSGDGTAYSALSASQFRGNCGKCIQINGARGSAVVKASAAAAAAAAARPPRARRRPGRANKQAPCAPAQVVDMCASCSFGDVDLSSNILKQTTGYAWDRKPITWDWVPCDGGASSASTSTPAATATPVPATPTPRPACPFPEGSIVRCPSTGDIFKIEGGSRRWFTPAAYAAAGQPPSTDYSCVDISYCPLAEMVPEAVSTPAVLLSPPPPTAATPSPPLPAAAAAATPTPATATVTPTTAATSPLPTAVDASPSPLPFADFIAAKPTGATPTQPQASPAASGGIATGAAVPTPAAGAATTSPPPTVGRKLRLR
eukprot:scaffold4.g4774.t1